MPPPELSECQVQRLFSPDNASLGPPWLRYQGLVTQRIELYGRHLPQHSSWRLACAHTLSRTHA